MAYKEILVVLIISTCLLYGDCNPRNIERLTNKCQSLKSCSSCLTQSYCTWCVIKSKCTHHACEHDNIIYPKQINALMSGPKFCPRILQPETTHIHPHTYKSGETAIIQVKITQIHMYMAFTPWTCKIHVNGQETVTVSAMLEADKVFCAPVVLNNESNHPYVDGSVTVLWHHSTKSLDGSVPIQIWNCDVDSFHPVCRGQDN